MKRDVSNETVPQSNITDLQTLNKPFHPPLPPFHGIIPDLYPGFRTQPFKLGFTSVKPGFKRSFNPSFTSGFSPGFLTDSKPDLTQVFPWSNHSLSLVLTQVYISLAWPLAYPWF